MFYIGNIGIDAVILITLGGFGVWTLFDFIKIVTDSFENKEGLAIKNR